ARQRERSRAGTKAELARHAERQQLYESILRRTGPTTFVGYETTSAEARIVAILRDAVEYAELTAVPEIELRAGAEAAAELVLDRTPFYPESGGQVGDTGVIRATDGSVLFTVEDTQRPVGGIEGLIVHRGRLHGSARVGDVVRAEVDAARRARTMRNHTGTHVLHRALRNVVGPAAKQAGSLVHPDYLRFDFPLDRPLTEGERRAIEAEVRRVIRDDLPVVVEYKRFEEALREGADAFFDEKYGTIVRTVRIDGYSHELCGGTHCRSTGQIGEFVIVGERSIGSGMRRIEALTGEGAERYLDERLELLDRIAGLVGAKSPEAIPDRIAALQDELREARRRLRTGSGLPRPGELAARAEEVAPGVRLVAFAGPFESIDALKGYARDVRAALGSGVVALGLDAEDPQLFVTVSDDLVARGIAAGELVRQAVGAIGGRGGGRAEMAQGKGTRRDGLSEALTTVRRLLANGMIRAT
ncbi:MAG TPA: alanine--tRNA ligase-related protein, partial [Candidatus Limnocylindrales bacterium]|nr:alanine--tRNA ligase-related protein [Candidatus Limnocylindrales bacterium]